MSGVLSTLDSQRYAITVDIAPSIGTRNSLSTKLHGPIEKNNPGLLKNSLLSTKD